MYSTDKNTHHIKPELGHFTMTVGEVVDTNDPLHLGRLRILCPSYGDQATRPIKDLPWALYASPLGGANALGTRGNATDSSPESSGSIAYGIWSIPKVGAKVIVSCIDGDPLS